VRIPSGYLRIKLNHDNDGTAELTAEVSRDGFSGVGGGWFNVSEVEAFATALQAYPLPTDPPPSISGGYLGERHIHVSIRAYPVNFSGALGVHVRVASPLYAGERPEEQRIAEVELATHYEELRRFALELIRVARAEAHEALLEPR
jgi:hypothetical protein